eukprot:943438-Pleurochrysis_carterae.AAC.1
MHRNVTAPCALTRASRERTYAHPRPGPSVLLCARATIRRLTSAILSALSISAKSTTSAVITSSAHAEAKQCGGSCSRYGHPASAMAAS